MIGNAGKLWVSTHQNNKSKSYLHIKIGKIITKCYVCGTNFELAQVSSYRCSDRFVIGFTKSWDICKHLEVLIIIIFFCRWFHKIVWKIANSHSGIWTEDLRGVYFLLFQELLMGRTQQCSIESWICLFRMNSKPSTRVICKISSLLMSFKW